MRIVVDTNIVFSGMLNTNSNIARILLFSKSKFNFYSSEILLYELEEHKDKLMTISGYTELQFERVFELFIRKIRLIEIRLIPVHIYNKAYFLTREVDPDDTEFVALTEYITGKLWSGDKLLRKGLVKKGWSNFITTQELFHLISSDH